MSFLAESRRITWIAVSAVAGLIAGQLVVCPGDFWRGIFILGFVPGILQGLVLSRLQPLVLVRWLILTQVGVATTYVFTLAALVGMAWVVALLEPSAWSGTSSGDAPSLAGWLLFISAFFVGGLGLGGLQVTGFPRQERRVTWVFATMLGGVAVAPIAMALTGLSDCRGAYAIPNQVYGLVGGSLYGLATALALPPRPDF